MKLIITTMGICALLTGASQSIAQGQKETGQSPGLKSEETQTIRATGHSVGWIGSTTGIH